MWLRLGPSEQPRSNPRLTVCIEFKRRMPNWTNDDQDVKFSTPIGQRNGNHIANFGLQRSHRTRLTRRIFELNRLHVILGHTHLQLRGGCHRLKENFIGFRRTKGPPHQAIQWLDAFLSLHIEGRSKRHGRPFCPKHTGLVRQSHGHRLQDHVVGKPRVLFAGWINRCVWVFREERLPQESGWMGSLTGAKPVSPVHNKATPTAIRRGVRCLPHSIRAAGLRRRAKARARTRKVPPGSTQINAASKSRAHRPVQWVAANAGLLRIAGDDEMQGQCTTRKRCKVGADLATT